MLWKTKNLSGWGCSSFPSAVSSIKSKVLSLEHGDRVTQVWLLCFLLLKNTRQKCLCAFPFRCLLSEKIILWFPLHCNVAMRKRNFFPVSLLQPFPMVTHYSISITGFHLWNLKFQYADFWLLSLILVSCHFDIHRLFFSSFGTSGLWILLFFSWSIALPFFH